MARKSTYEKVREICLSLPETKETITWGQPHFRVGEKIFAGYGDEKGKATIGFKLEMEHADLLVREDDRFERAPYVGHKGWVSMDAARVGDWNELRDLIRESYRLIAPKKLVKLLDGEAPAEQKTKKPATAEKPARVPGKSRQS